MAQAWRKGVRKPMAMPVRGAGKGGNCMFDGRSRRVITAAARALQPAPRLASITAGFPQRTMCAPVQTAPALVTMLVLRFRHSVRVAHRRVRFSAEMTAQQTLFEWEETIRKSPCNPVINGFPPIC